MFPHAWVNAGPHAGKIMSITEVVTAEIALVVAERLTKQLRPIPACNAHELPLAPGVIRQVVREVVHLAVERGPCVISCPVLLEHRRGNPQ